MASFNFDKFDTEFEMKQMLRNVTEALDALRNPADVNERLVPLEPGTPLQRLMEQLRVGTDEAVPVFDFELADVLTIEEAGRLCRERVVDGLPAPVNLPEMLITAGQRLFFNINMAARPTTKRSAAQRPLTSAAKCQSATSWMEPRQSSTGPNRSQNSKD